MYDCMHYRTLNRGHT